MMEGSPPPSIWWNLLSFSWVKGTPLNEQKFRFDSSMGEGVTIFVVDSGANVAGPRTRASAHLLTCSSLTLTLILRWQQQLRNPQTYVVPNRLTMTDIPDGYVAAPEDMTDWENHGTSMACSAGGTMSSTANKANLYLIKRSNMVQTMGLGRNVGPLEHPDSLHDALFHVVNVVRQNNLQGKAVVLSATSWDFARWANDTNLQDQYEQDHGNGGYTPVDKLVEAINGYTKVWDEYLAAARDLGIITVVPAGNDGYNRDPATGGAKVVVAQGDAIPMNRGGRDSEIMVVGAGDQKGRVTEFSSPRGIHVNGDLVQDDTDPRLAAYGYPSLGFTDVYGPGEHVMSCTNIDGKMARITGTSPASAQVAGLVAYFLGYPFTDDRFVWSEEKNKRKVWGLRMKEWISTLSYQWTDGDEGIIDPQYRPYITYNLPEEVNMAYNGAAGPMRPCAVPNPNKRDANDSDDEGADLCIAAANMTEVTSWATASLTFSTASDEIMTTYYDRVTTFSGSTIAYPTGLSYTGSDASPLSGSYSIMPTTVLSSSTSAPAKATMTLVSSPSAALSSVVTSASSNTTVEPSWTTIVTTSSNPNPKSTTISSSSGSSESLSTVDWTLTLTSATTAAISSSGSTIGTASTSKSMTTVDWTLTLGTTTQDIPASTEPISVVQITVVVVHVSTYTPHVVVKTTIQKTIIVTPTTSSDIYTTTVESDCCPYADAFCCNPAAAPDSYEAPTACVGTGNAPQCGAFAGW